MRELFHGVAGHIASDDRIDVRLDCHCQVFWNATQRVKAGWGDLCGNHGHVIVVPSVIERNESEGAGVHVHLGLLTFFGETFDAVKAAQEMAEAVVPIEGVHVLHEGRAVYLRGIDQWLAQHLVAKKGGHEFLIVRSGGHQVDSEVWIWDRVGAIRHVIGLNEVLLDDLLDVQPTGSHGHGSGQLQVIGIVGIHLAGCPDELHVFVDPLGTALQISRGAIARLRRQAAAGDGNLVGGLVGPPVPRCSRVGLLPRVPIPKARGETEQHAVGHGGSEIFWILSPPGQVLGNRIIQALDRAVLHETSEHHGGWPLAGTSGRNLCLEREVSAFVGEQAAMRGIPHNHRILGCELPLLQDLAQRLPS